jgi:hypothetical protein
MGANFKFGYFTDLHLLADLQIKDLTIFTDFSTKYFHNA